MKKVERETFIKDKPMAQLIACEAQIHHKPRVSISNMYSDAYTYYICSNTYPIIFMIFGKQKKSSSGRRFLGPPPDAMPPTAPPQNLATPSSRGADVGQSTSPDPCPQNPRATIFVSSRWLYFASFLFFLANLSSYHCTSSLAGRSWGFPFVVLASSQTPSTCHLFPRMWSTKEPD